MTLLEKLAAKLTQKEERRLAGEFAALGTIAGPVASGASNLIMRGKLAPFSTKTRWLLGSAAAGALTGGAFPAIRHALERRTKQIAREREQKAELRRTKRRLASMTKVGVMNLTGRDNRTPFTGGTQFPTEGSKQFSKNQFEVARSKSEAGPAPMTKSPSQMSAGNSTVFSQSVKMPSAIGSLPKIGEDMSIMHDPLIRYFQTEHGRQELYKHADRLEYNLTDLPLGKQVRALVAEPPGPTTDALNNSRRKIDESLRELFSNYSSETLVDS